MGIISSPPGRILAIDYGTARVGIALSDPTQQIASGLETIQRQGSDDVVIQRILQLIQQWDVQKIILGMPLRTDGKPGEKEMAVKAFSKTLQQACGLRPIFQNEAYTTVKAHELLSEVGYKRKDRRPIIDQIAAEYILQDYLDDWIQKSRR